MSRTQSPEALTFAERVSTSQSMAARIAELEKKVQDYEQWERELRHPHESQIKRLDREMEEFLAKHKAACEEAEKQAELARIAAENAEVERLRTEVQDPPLAVLRAFMDAVVGLLSYAGSCSHIAEHEKLILPHFERVVDTLLPLPTEFKGWPKPVVRALQALIDEFRRLAGSWGWHELIAPPEARQAILEKRQREWDQKTIIGVKRYAELWVRMGDLGLVHYPSDRIVAIGRKAQKEGVPHGPIPIDRRLRGNVLNTHQSRIHPRDLFNYAEQLRNTTPALGTRRPEIDPAQRFGLAETSTRLQRALPTLRDPSSVGDPLPPPVDVIPNPVGRVSYHLDSETKQWKTVDCPSASAL